MFKIFFPPFFQLPSVNWWWERTLSSSEYRSNGYS